MLAGPPHPPKEGRQEQCDSRWKRTVSFRSPVECRGHSSNKYDALKSPGGEWGDDGSHFWGANESWQLSTPASSPKPRHKDSPKGATHDDHGVRDQPIETIEGGGVEQASYRRGEDS